MIENQARLLLTIARHWVKEPAHVRFLKVRVANLHVPHEGMTAKNRARLKQFDLPENVDLILTLPSRVFRETNGRNSLTYQNAVRLMYAVALQVLIFTPIRLENLHKLEWGKTLHEVRRGRKRLRYLSLAEMETKNKRVYEVPLPEEIDWILQAWLTKYQKRVFVGQTLLLFPSPSGGVRNPTAFSRNLGKFIERETGLKVNTHLFRQLAGKLYLAHDDRGIETVRQLLGHMNTRTTLRSYAHLGPTHAARRHAAVVLGMMKPPTKGRSGTSRLGGPKP